MKKRELIWIGIIILIGFSCEKLDTPRENDTATYYPLEIGNYWVYNYVKIDTLNNVTDLPYTDSITIKRDTIINNKLYYVLEGSSFLNNRNKWGITEILRDSLGFIVTHKGEIRFSVDNFTDTLYKKAFTIAETDTISILTYKMETVDKTITVPAGEFTDVLNFNGTLHSFDAPPSVKSPRYQELYYAEGVGKILESYHYYSHPGKYQKRLVKYHISE